MNLRIVRAVMYHKADVALSISLESSAASWHEELRFGIIVGVKAFCLLLLATISTCCCFEWTHHHVEGFHRILSVDGRIVCPSTYERASDLVELSVRRRTTSVPVIWQNSLSFDVRARFVICDLAFGRSSGRRRSIVGVR